jgi:RNA polymerase sigma-70 factor (ECF subfamily)
VPMARRCTRRAFNYIIIKKPTRGSAFCVISGESSQSCKGVRTIDCGDEDRLLSAMRTGGEDALGAVIDRYTGYVGTIVWNIIGSAMSTADAEEVVSEVFYTLWQNADKVRPGSLRGYLASIARSRAKNKLREARIDLYLEDDLLEEPDPSPEKRLGDAERAEYLRAALKLLPPRDRDILVRHYYYYETTAQISQDTGIPRETVKTRLKQGREALRKILSREAV